MLIDTVGLFSVRVGVGICISGEDIGGRYTDIASLVAPDELSSRVNS